jgi:hypothetical protein
MNRGQPEEAKEGWTYRYEDLRRGALQGYAPVRNSWGVALFLRQGLVAWMHAWPKEQASSKKCEVDRPVHHAIDRPEPSPSLGTQFISVLADILLHRPQEVRT